MIARLFAETTTIGLRHWDARRRVLARRIVEVETRFGRVPVKRIQTPGGVTLIPEYEVCRRIARDRDLPLKRVYAEMAEDVSRIRTED